MVMHTKREVDIIYKVSTDFSLVLVAQNTFILDKMYKHVALEQQTYYISIFILLQL